MHLWHFLLSKTAEACATTVKDFIPDACQYDIIFHSSRDVSSHQCEMFQHQHLAWQFLLPIISFVSWGEQLSFTEVNRTYHVLALPLKSRKYIHAHFGTTYFQCRQVKQGLTNSDS